MKDFFKRHYYFALAFAVYTLAKMVIATCKKDIVRSEKLKQFEAENNPAIYTVWHGRIFPMLFFKPNIKQLYAIISRHGDGEMIANVLSFGGVKAIRGSTDRVKGGKSKLGVVKFKKAQNRGGSFAIRETMRILESGNSVVITPDGPKGPRHVFKPSSIKIASEKKVPIIPVSFSASKVHIFESWDRLVMPLPFSKIKIEYGEMIYIPGIDGDIDLEKYGKQVENTLNDLTDKLDKESGIEV